MLIDFYLENVTKNKTMLLPVTPENYSVTDDMQVETVKLASLGDINIPTFYQPQNLTIEGTFSTDETHYINKNLIPDLITKTIDYVNVIREWQKAKDVIRVLIVPRGTTEARLDAKFYIRSINIDGELEGIGDIVYSLDFVEYVDTSIKTIAGEKAVAKRPIPPTKQAVASKNKQYTVVKGDNLWNIARKYYGNGAEYTKILNANKGKIKNKDLIFPGQILTIPGVK